MLFDCFNRRDLRECAQYHYFPVNHRFLDRLVESVPINRFSAFAASKTVPGLMCGLLLCFDSRDRLQGTNGGHDYDHLTTLRSAINDGTIQPDALCDAVKEIILGNGDMVSSSTLEQTRLAIEEAFAECWQLARTEFRYDRLRDAVRAMTSFRDVDRMVEFVPDSSAGIVERL